MGKKSFEEFNILEVLKKLSNTRKLFHCEADFQFELAWKIKEMYNVNIRMEYPYSKKEENYKKIKRYYIDILVIDNNFKNAIPIELKYKTKEENKYIEKSESYNLTQQSAHNDNRYYIYKDIERVQHLVKTQEKKKYNNIKDFKITEGYVVFLTNDEVYIKNKRSNTVDKYFEIAAKKDFEQIKKEIFNIKNGEKIDDVYKVKDFQNNVEYKNKENVELLDKPAGEWYKFSEYDNKYVYQLVFTIK